MSAFEKIDHVARAKKKRKSLQAFYTPENVIKLMLDTTNVFPSMRILEPSAGDGRIVFELVNRGCKHVDFCEIDEEMHAKCSSIDGASGVAKDFLSYNPGEIYDLIVMNPPFTKRQDQRHVEHAYSMLRPGGEIVSLASPSLADPLCGCQLNLSECQYAVYEQLASGLFEESGTNIAVLLVTIRKHIGEQRECLGFSNHATANAALTVETDYELYTQARRIPEHVMPEANAGRMVCEWRRAFEMVVGERGGSCYGVDWAEVALHFSRKWHEEELDKYPLIYLPKDFRSHPKLWLGKFTESSQQLDLFEQRGAA